MASEIYTSTEWVNYPSTATPITAGELNRMEKAILEVPKETATFLLSSVLGGLKAVQSVPMMSTVLGTVINNYNPQNGDKLLVWKSNAIPCVEDTDYSITEEEGVYKIKSIGQNMVANLQIWNIPTNTGGGAIGTAYPNISSLTTDSISGTIEESD